jgi:GT2 family glycosyltransferase
MGPRVAIVIPNWNGWRDTIECLESLWKLNYGDFWTVVVDNGSTDDSLLRIREYCSGDSPGPQDPSEESDPEAERTFLAELGHDEAQSASPDDFAEMASRRRLVLIRSESNLGFARGSNVGMDFSLKALKAKYILLLNNDTVVDPALLTELVAVGERDGRIGLLGPKTYYYSYDGRKDVILYAGGRIVPWREIVYKHIGTGERDTGQYDEDGETDWCTGGGMMIRAELAKQRLLNTEYPFGNEDAEYSIKARKDSWKVVYVHKAVMWHKVGVSRAKTGATLRRGLYWYFRFIKSNFSPAWYVYHVYLFVGVVLPKWLFMYIALHGDRHALRGFLSEIRKFIG